MRPLGKGRTTTTHNTIHNAASRTDTWHQSRQCCPSSPRHRTVKTILIETIVDYNVFGGNYSTRIGLRFYVFSKSKKRDFLRFLKCHVKKNIKNVESVVQGSTFLPARRYASAGNSDRNVSVRPSVRLSRAGIVSKRRKLAAWFIHHLVAPRL